MGEEVVCDGEAVGEAIGEALCVDVVPGFAEETIEGLLDGVGEGVIVTPLFHTNFFPDLIQVYIFPL